MQKTECRVEQSYDKSDVGVLLLAPGDPGEMEEISMGRLSRGKDFSLLRSPILIEMNLFLKTPILL